MELIFLPPELHLKIFEYLDYTDVKTCRQLSTTFSRLVHTTFINRTVLTLCAANFRCNRLAISDFQARYKIPKVKMNKINFTEIRCEKEFDEFWSPFYNCIRHLTLRRCYFNEYELDHVLQKMVNLKTLCMYHMRFVYDLIQLLENTVSKIKTLIIDDHYDKYETSAVTQCYLPEGTVTTIEYLRLVLGSRDNTLFTSNAMRSLFRIIEGSLKHLTLEIHDFDTDIAKWLRETNFNLESFNFKIRGRVENYDEFTEFVFRICRQSEVGLHKLKNSVGFGDLKKLKIFINVFDEHDIFSGHLQTLDLSRLPNLEHFNFYTHCHSVLNRVILAPNWKLRKLTLQCNFSNDVIVYIAKHLKNLNRLSLKNTIQLFPQQLLPTIFSSLPNLEKLIIFNLLLFREDVGREILPEPPNNQSISSLKNLKQIQFFGVTAYRDIFKQFSNLSALETVTFVDCCPVYKIDIENLILANKNIASIQLNEIALSSADILHLRLMAHNKNLKIKVW